MLLRRALFFLAAFLLLPTVAYAGTEGEHVALDLPLWSIIPFVFLLLSIAVMPLAAGHWWHSNRNQGFVVLSAVLPVLLYLLYLHLAKGLPTLGVLEEKVLEYVAFIVMLGSLYVVSGGIVISGDLPGKPAINLGFLLLGALLANAIGTTGASILLIRPVLRINRRRTNKWHIPMFFIFVVSNTGGLLTPLGDPPLFLGFLDGVPFFWTFSLYPEWLFVNGFILAIFFIWDTIAFRKEPLGISAAEEGQKLERLRLRGAINLFFLAAIIAAVLLQGVMTGPFREIVPTGLMLAMGAMSLTFTPDGLRALNSFTWEPILEVAVLFAGIFVTMIPALQILGPQGAALGVTQPWQFFWLTGVLSSLLDNAPTYLTFSSLASGEHDLAWLAINQPHILKAISCGAVFMGALTYIGNGPNFMIKAIAKEAGYPMPSFFGYLAYASGVLLPIFGLATLVFFRTE
ncbi:MAG TPA: sodium:proton antiporter [Gemmataceae bacterium]|jgi:Na+/H+ antiporter NhaD/arsenite permease-like protein|nr:sodium:proton antiporter [Gemmataceae bacterium]